MKPRLTLGQFFFLSLLGLTLLLALLFYFLLDGSYKSIVDSSERLREAHSKRIGGQVEQYLDQAPKVVDAVENEIKQGACRADAPASIESCLFAQIVSNPNLAEATLTHDRRIAGVRSPRGWINGAEIPTEQIRVASNSGAARPDAPMKELSSRLGVWGSLTQRP